MERRFWLGAGILLVFLALGLWVSKSMNDVHEPIGQILEQASQKAVEGNAEDSAALVRTAKELWEQHWNGTACVADHEPMEEIDSLFSQVETYEKAEDLTQLAAYCARLSQLVEAIGDAHSLNWWNLL